MTARQGALAAIVVLLVVNLGWWLYGVVQGAGSVGNFLVALALAVFLLKQRRSGGGRDG